MNRIVVGLVLISILVSCSSTPELETGEIKTIALIKQAFQKSNRSKRFKDARFLIDRKQIDEAEVPVLFVELPSGQNGTLTLTLGKVLGKHG